MKKFLYAIIGSLLYIAPLVALYIQIQGGKLLRKELEGVRKAIENLNPKENSYEWLRKDHPIYPDHDSGCRIVVL